MTSDHGDGAAGAPDQAAPPGTPPPSTVRATASVPNRPMSPPTPPEPPAAEWDRPGPFPPAGPTRAPASVPPPPPGPPGSFPGFATRSGAEQPPAAAPQPAPVPPPAAMPPPPAVPGGFTARAQVSVPPDSTASMPRVSMPPPATGSYQTSAPPASAPPAAGVYQASAPPAATPPSSAPPAAGLYGAPPAAGVYGAPGSAAPPPGPYGTPPFGDVNTHGEGSQQMPPDGTEAPPAPKSRRGLVLGLVIVVVVFLLAVAGTAIVVALNSAGDTTFAVNSCVKQDGDRAEKANCSDPGAYTVVSKVDKQQSCPDPNQPFIVLQNKGSKDQVLCLRPASQK